MEVLFVFHVSGTLNYQKILRPSVRLSHNPEFSSLLWNTILQFSVSVTQPRNLLIIMEYNKPALSMSVTQPKILHIIMEHNITEFSVSVTQPRNLHTSYVV